MAEAVIKVEKGRDGQPQVILSITGTLTREELDSLLIGADALRESLFKLKVNNSQRKK